MSNAKTPQKAQDAAPAARQDLGVEDQLVADPNAGQEFPVNPTPVGLDRAGDPRPSIEQSPAREGAEADRVSEVDTSVQHEGTHGKTDE